MPLWKEIAVALLVLAIFGNLVYWLFIAEDRDGPDEIKPDAHDQTFSM